MRLPEIVRKEFARRFRDAIHAAKVERMMAENALFQPYYYFQSELAEAKNRAKVIRVVESVLRVKVDWRFKDEEILEEIRRFLHKSRPSGWHEQKRLYGRSLFPEFFSPTTYRAALGWLGVLRCRNAGCGWYHFEDYGIMIDGPELRKRAKWAKAILAWMKDGKSSHLDCLPAEKARQRRAKI